MKFVTAFTEDGACINVNVAHIVYAQLEDTGEGSNPLITMYLSSGVVVFTQVCNSETSMKLYDSLVRT